MTRKRFLLVVPIVALLAGTAYVSQTTESAGAQMTTAGDKFLRGLTEDQKKKVLFAFDDKERFNWHFVPLQEKDKKSTRKGLRLEEMTPAQKEAALELLRAGTSDTGYKSARTIMSLESVLFELERSKANVRNPQWYFFTVFGTPSKTGKWGWRVEGHHLCLNFTLEDGKLVSATPAFFGANPAIITRGDRKGLKALPEAEESALQLYASLTADQAKTAVQSKQFADVPQAVRKPNVGAPVGLAAANMNEKQKAILWNLLKGYANRMPGDVAATEMKALEDAGFDKIHFAFAREDNRAGKPYTYRVQGPTFLIEFLNVQEDGANIPANHIHSVWRNIKGDFGLTE